MLKYLIIIFLICTISSGCKQSATIATVNYNFSGCFGSITSKLTIYKNNDSVMAKIEEVRQNIRMANRTVKLSTLQVDTFNLFVQQLKSKDLSGGCTTREQYIVRLKDEIIRKNDDSCDWNGFSSLRKCLFQLTD